jgi:hypothetical protein
MIMKMISASAAFVPMMAGLFAAGIFIIAAPASAQRLVNEGLPPSDPIEAYAEDSASRNTFFLNSTDDVELVRFKRMHDLSLCVARADPDAIGAARHAYPVRVSWDENVGVVTPGNCLAFDAQRVKVSPAAAIPQGIMLTGSIRVLK